MQKEQLVKPDILPANKNTQNKTLLNRINSAAENENRSDSSKQQQPVTAGHTHTHTDYSGNTEETKRSHLTNTKTFNTCYPAWSFFLTLTNTHTFHVNPGVCVSADSKGVLPVSSVRVYACVVSHLGVATEEAVWNRNIDVKVQCLQDADFHGDELRTLVGIITNI